MKAAIFGLNMAAALAAFAAATFWFLSARGKVPGMISYWDGTPPEDPFYQAFIVSVKMNRWAAAFSGFAAVLAGVSVILQTALQL